MAPPQGQMRPGRQLAVLGAIFVILYALVWFGGGDAGWRERFEPKLGLDLIGGTQVTLEARTQDGKPPPAGNLEEAKRIIEQRVNGLGVTEAEVVTEGDTNITVSLAGRSDDRLKSIGTPAQLRFRKVLGTTGDSGAGLDATPSATPSATAAASATPSAPATPSAAASRTPTTPATPPATPSATAAATPPATGTPAATGAPGASAAPVPPTLAELRRTVEAKIGPALWAQANGLQQPLDFSQDPVSAELFAPFKTLSAAEVAVLPTPMHFNIPYITCEKLNDRPPGSILDETQQAVACDENGTEKLLLDIAKVLGTDVDDADSGLDPEGGGFMVTIQFRSEGQDKWTNLTKEAYGTGAEADKKRVAVVLDNTVVSAPVIQSVIPDDAQITGSFSRADAQLLASQLRYGALPLTFETQEAKSVSATLGSSHLRAGLLAAGIGMLLVVLYSFFYYRLLGSVIFLSLVLSALLVFGALIVLGREIGFTLTLAGIAGFIVSLGVAADSFVIYFERLKDEIREGRSPRSAVPRAWARARRTIISANAITLLAAVVLYAFSVGSVKGFAFALGLATFLDLVVVFLFRHPIMTMFARTKAFLSPRVSGLGRVLQNVDPNADAVTPSRRGSRVKEA